ncbi:MAG: penicillin-binding protein 2 [Actinomycetota bacterium]|nr:penicillin-binding protein 2 [Actinomycetota bacterium]
MLAVLAVVAGRLVQLQGFDATAYAAQAEKQRLRTVALPAARGEITDRNGSALALTVDARAVYANPRLVVDAGTTAAALAPLLHEPVDVLVKKLGRNGGFVYLARGLDVAVGHQVSALKLPGVGTAAEFRRVHPGKDLGANVVGFTGTENHGLAGVELAYDKLLAGRDGTQTTEVDHAGRVIPSGAHREQEAVPGRSVSLTIDRDMQWMAQQTLVAKVAETRAKGGTVVVLDPRTGELLALATAPTLDADDPGKAPAEARGNPAVSEVYEPGSVNKVITAAAALDAGVVTPDSAVTVPPQLKVADKMFTDAEAHGTEQLTFTGVLAKSSNIGTIEVAQRLGKAALYDYLTRFGLGAPTGTGFPGESAGILPKPADWSGSQAGTIPIGQGVSVTSLQVASVFGTIANGGVRVAPRLVKSTTDAAGAPVPAPAPVTTTVVSPATASQLTTMMEAVTSNEGTAPEARIDGYRVAGKTGTAKRVDSACSCYRGYTASFVGFAPADAPQLVVEVVLQDPQTEVFGGAVAAPVFHDVMAFALMSRGIAPTGTPSPTARLTIP